MTLPQVYYLNQSFKEPCFTRSFSKPGTLSYAVYELATHPDIQTQLRKEIDFVLGEVGENNLDYATIQGMEYLDQVIMETTRLHSLAAMLSR